MKEVSVELRQGLSFRLFSCRGEPEGTPREWTRSHRSDSRRGGYGVPSLSLASHETRGESGGRRPTVGGLGLSNERLWKLRRLESRTSRPQSWRTYSRTPSGVGRGRQVHRRRRSRERSDGTKFDKVSNMGDSRGGSGGVGQESGMDVTQRWRTCVDPETLPETGTPR